MQDIIENALKNHNADYLELRIEETERSTLRYRGRDLEEISQTTGLGGCVRAAVNGGWGFVSFNDLSQLQDRVSMAIRQARLVGSTHTNLAEVKPTISISETQFKADPRLTTLQEKKRILDQYLDLLWTEPKTQSAVLAYSDSYRKVHYGNSVGTYLSSHRSDVNFRAVSIAREGGEVQQAGISMGSLGDFTLMENLYDEVAALPKKALEFLKAPPVKGGEYPVVLDPILAGVFIHEAFGHLSEADHVYENVNLQEIMTLGRRFGGKHLNVVDGAAIPNLRGSYEYDDEGVPATRTDLIREGLLVGRLHSRETAAKMGETPTGNARAINYRFPPIVRMTNTIIEPGEATFDDLISDIKLGVYCGNWYGGMTSMEQFTFSAGEAHMIRNGRIAELVRPVLLSGNVFVTLKNLDAIGNDLDINQGGGCGKSGQSPLPVSNGSPHIRLKRCLVGGG